MTYEQDSNKYASSGVGTAGLTLGVIGTALASGIVGNLGNGGLFGGRSTSAQDELCQLRTQNAILASENSTDKKLVEVYTTLRALDKNQDQNLANLNSRLLALETAAPLKEQLVDAKISAVYDKITCCCNSATAAIQSTNTALSNLQSVVGNLTKIVIPINNVCPQPMPLYNSWTAPAAPTTANSNG